MKHAVFFSILMLLPCESIFAKGKGYNIAKKADEYHRNFDDSLSEGIMILKSRGKVKTKRELSVKLLRGKVSNDKSLMVFSVPKDIKGTALLTHTFSDKDDDQWIYLPAIRRVKRIVSSARTGPFLGSEFSYEDMTPREFRKYSYKFLKEEKCGKYKCNILEAVSKGKDSAYSKEVLYITKKNHLLYKVKYYDRSKKHFKTLAVTKHKIHDGKFWSNGKLTMTNHRNKKESVLEWNTFKFNNGFNSRTFDQRSLKNVR